MTAPHPVEEELRLLQAAVVAPRFFMLVVAFGCFFLSFLAGFPVAFLFALTVVSQTVEQLVGLLILSTGVMTSSAVAGLLLLAMGITGLRARTESRLVLRMAWMHLWMVRLASVFGWVAVLGILLWNLS